MVLGKLRYMVKDYTHFSFLDSNEPLKNGHHCKFHFPWIVINKVDIE